MINFLKKAIKHFKTISFVFGFSLDLFFLPKVTSEYYIWIGPIDIAIVLGFIFLRQSIKRILESRVKHIKKEIKEDPEERKNKNINIETRKSSAHRFLDKMNVWITYFVSFFLGTLLSHTLVYYFRSSDFLQMWPIFLIVIIAILANEFLYGVVPDILLFFIALTFYIIFNVPFFLNKVNNLTFFISILLSVIITSILTIVLQRIYLSKKEFVLLILFSIVFPFLLLKLYYSSYIPAVPLTLGDSNFYSFVQKENNNQNLVSYEKETVGLVENKIYFFINNNYYNYESLKGQGLYFFSSIISPADISAEITHVWEKYNETKGGWEEIFRVNYSITGGRESGYRGYSKLTNITKGEWRVRVLADDRLVGLKKIEVK